MSQKRTSIRWTTISHLACQRAGIPNPLFDTAWYLRENPDVAKAGLNPLAHYASSGATEGRDPHPEFSSRWYLDQHPHIAQAGINPLVHYLREGNGHSASYDRCRPGPAVSRTHHPKSSSECHRETRTSTPHRCDDLSASLHRLDRGRQCGRPSRQYRELPSATLSRLAARELDAKYFLDECCRQCGMCLCHMDRAAATD